jgi:uncharacterized protein (DUF58 family)
MLTPRGGRFLLVVFVLLALAVFGQYLCDLLVPSRRLILPRTSTVALLALTLLLWFVWEWLLFAARARLLVRRLAIRRELFDEHGRIETLWAGVPFRVRVEIAVPGALAVPYLTVADRLPFGVEATLGDTFYEGPLQQGSPAQISYSLRCPGVGRIRFEGLAVQLADLQGFFYHATFLPLVGVYPVLPSLTDTGTHAASVKRHNLLLPPGVHRHRRPGSGSELLDLRDYLPGDPPKTIAWKVSARRDRLITKEFESEVPVRCTLFVDTSDSVRLGPPGRNALARLVEIAAGVARTAADNRDLTGLCRFDEHRAMTVRPARGARHLVHLLNLLAEAAGLTPAAGKARLDELLPLSYAFAREVYPELLRPDVNHFPFWLAWLWPPPAHTVRQPKLADYLYPWLPFLLPVYLAASLVLLILGFLELTELLGEWNPPVGPFLLILGTIVFGWFMLLLRFPISFFFVNQRRRLRWRKGLAALLSVRYGLAPGGLGMLLEDDDAFGQYLQRFLTDHHVPYPLPLYDRQGRYLFAAPAKVKVLATALLRAVGKGHDNEMFVLLADLLELEEELGPLLRAVRVALARHHRVMLVCPWPPGVPTPGEKRQGDKETSRQGDDERTAMEQRAGNAGGPVSLSSRLRQTTAQRFHGGYHRLRRTFARLGVPVVCARSGDPARLILERLDMLRELGRKR